MRIVPIAALLLTLPALAHAQAARPAEGAPPASTLPPIGLPLPQIGLPLPPLGLAPGPTPTTTTPAPGRQEPAPRRGPAGRHGRGAAPAVIYVVPSYGWSVTAASPTPGTIAPAAAPSAEAASRADEGEPTRPGSGTLRLELQPRPTGQLFVDGAYVGTVEDLGTDLLLPAGTRHVQIRQAGYEPFELTARVQEGRELVYRGTLVADRPASPKPASAPPAPKSAAPSATATPATPAAPIARKPLYFIPGCYLGDVPPHEAGLPPTCDLSRAVIYKP